MRETFKTIGGCLVAILFAACIFALVGLFFMGAERFCEIVYPWLCWVSAIALLFCIFVFLPLSFFKFSRGFAAIGLIIASYMFGITLWIWSLLITSTLWGLAAVIVGVAFAGVGVVLMAILAMLFHGEWSTLGQVVLLILFTWGTRFWGIALSRKAENEVQLN